jgi:hypothetical protein
MNDKTKTEGFSVFIFKLLANMVNMNALPLLPSQYSIFSTNMSVWTPVFLYVDDNTVLCWLRKLKILPNATKTGHGIITQNWKHYVITNLNEIRKTGYSTTQEM